MAQDVSLYRRQEHYIVIRYSSAASSLPSEKNRNWRALGDFGARNDAWRPFCPFMGLAVPRTVTSLPKRASD